MQAIRRFKTDTSGATAMLFGLSLLPLFGMVGAAIDYSRGAAVQSEFQKAVDAAALSLAPMPLSATQRELDDRASGVFQSNMRAQPSVTRDTLVVSREGRAITVAVAGRMQTAVMTVFGMDTMTIGAKAAVLSGSNKIEIALVLDNTGSMAESGKMDALKKAMSKLVDDLKKASPTKGDIKVSVVPFNTQVKLDASANRNADWLRFDVTTENPNVAYRDRTAPTRRDWEGCIADRDQRYDISSEAPTGLQQTKYVAAQCHSGTMASTRFLTDDLESIRATTNSMQPAGATNIAVGLTAGLATLRSDNPMGAKSSDDPEVQKFLILLTDGQNTQNRWGGNGGEGNSYVGQIDSRLRGACDEARARQGNVQVFTIRVIAGNEDLLRSCATSPSMYKEVKNAAEMQPVFDQILRAIIGTRLTS